MVTSPVLSPGVRDDGLSPSGGEGLVMPISREGSLMRNIKTSRANMLLSESSASLEQVSNDISAAQDRLIQLVKVAGAWSSHSFNADAHSVAGNVSPAAKKDRRKFVLRRRKNKTNSTSEPPASASMSESESGQIFQLKPSHFTIEFIFI